MKRRVVGLWASALAMALLLVACESPTGSAADAEADTTGDGEILFTVTYNANGADSGTVPIDSSEYATGESVTVLGNSGGLAREGHEFGGWNRSPDQTGTTYLEGAVITIQEDDLTLYAIWLPKGSITIDFQNPANPEITFSGATAEVLSGSVLSLTVEGSYTGHRWFLNGTTSHPGLSTSGPAATIDTDEIGHGSHSVTVLVAEGYSAHFSFEVVDTLSE